MGGTTRLKGVQVCNFTNPAERWARGTERNYKAKKGHGGRNDTFFPFNHLFVLRFGFPSSCSVAVTQWLAEVRIPPPVYRELS